MFWITEDPSSGSLVQCLAKNYKNDSIMSVDMDKVGIMAVHWCSSLYMMALYMKCLHIHTRTTGQNTLP